MKTPLIAALVFAVAACSPAPPPASPVQPALPGPATAVAPAAAGSLHGVPETQLADQRDAAVLDAYHWQLAAATDASGARIDALFARADRPVQLDFGPHALSVSNACNRLRGSWSLRGDALAIGPFASTLMACNDNRLDALDAAIGQYLAGELRLTLDTGGGAPTLRLATAHGDVMTFNGMATAETRYHGTGETMFLEVAAAPAHCPATDGAKPACLTVRDVHYDGDGLRSGEPGPWHTLTQPIEGYTHRPGVHQTLRLKRYAVPDAPAGASSVAYVLDMIVASERTGTHTPPAPPPAASTRH